MRFSLILGVFFLAHTMLVAQVDSTKIKAKRLYDIGVSKYVDKNLHEADQLITKAIAMDSSDAHFFNALGLIKQEQGHYAQARKLYEHAIHKD